MALGTADIRNGIALAISLLAILLWGVPLSHLLWEGAFAVTSGEWDVVDVSLLESLWVAFSSASIACMLGGISSYLLFKLPERAHNYLGILFLLPLFLPSYLHALAWADFMGTVDWLKRSGVAQSKTGMAPSIWVLSVSYYPVATAILYAALSKWDIRFAWAAWSNGVKPHHVGMMLARYFLPSVLVAWFIAFLLIMGDFAVTDFYGVHTYASEIFVLISSYLDISSAIKKYFSIFVITILGVVVVIEQQKKIALAAPYASVLSERKTSRWFLVPSILFVFIVVALPFCNLLSNIGQVKVMGLALKMIAPDIGYGLGMAACIALTSTVFALFGAYFIERKIAPAGAWISFLSLLVFALPASLLGLAMISLWNQNTVLGWAYDSGVVLWLAIGLRWCPLPLLILQYGWRRAGTDGEESAAANGIPWFASFLQVGLPRVLPHLMAAFLLTFIFSFNELTLFTLLAPPGVSSLPLRVFQTVHYGPRSLLSAICLWQVLLLILPLLLLGALMKHEKNRQRAVPLC